VAGGGRDIEYAGNPGCYGDKPEGRKAVIRNWKTSLSGLVTALSGFVAFSPELFSRWPWVVALSKYAMVGGLAGMGLYVKDKNVSGNPSQVEAEQLKASAAKANQ
jgi:predicted exporter